MTTDEIRRSIASGDAPPPGLDGPLLALWCDRAGDWDRAHALVANLTGRPAARVHAYLHRREGDEDNARYWYARAGASPATGDLAAEWDDLVASLAGG